MTVIADIGSLQAMVAGTVEVLEARHIVQIMTDIAVNTRSPEIVINRFRMGRMTLI